MVWSIMTGEYATSPNQPCPIFQPNVFEPMLAGILLPRHGAACSSLKADDHRAVTIAAASQISYARSHHERPMGVLLLSRLLDNMAAATLLCCALSGDHVICTEMTKYVHRNAMHTSLPAAVAGRSQPRFDSHSQRLFAPP